MWNAIHVIFKTSFWCRYACKYIYIIQAHIISANNIERHSFGTQVIDFPLVKFSLVLKK